MLTEKQTKEIREHLDKAQNPVFYYDNDCDGLCSFLILRRYLGKGKGVAVRSYPDLNVQYARKAKELNADYVFVLDKPVIAKGFIEEIAKLQLSLVWIDHHNIEGEDFYKDLKDFFVYNPARNSGKEKSDEPVTYLVYKLTERKENLWLAIIGCIADHYMPDFADRFARQYPEFWGNVLKPFDAYYKTEIGKIAQGFNFGLKDSTSNIVHLQNFLISCKGPDVVFMEMSENYFFRKKYQEIRKKYDFLISKAHKSVDGKAIFFIYAGDVSVSADIANELSYLYPDKYIAVAYKKGIVSNISLRGKNVKKILINVLKKFENASGGGHEDAVGSSIRTEDLGKFKDIFIDEVKKR